MNMRCMEYNKDNLGRIGVYYVKNSLASTVSIIGSIITIIAEICLVILDLYNAGTYLATTAAFIGVALNSYVGLSCIPVLVAATSSNATLCLQLRTLTIILFIINMLLGIGITIVVLFQMINATNEEALNTLSYSLTFNSVIFALMFPTFLPYFFLFTKHDDVRYTRYTSLPGMQLTNTQIQQPSFPQQFIYAIPM